MSQTYKLNVFRLCDIILIVQKVCEIASFTPVIFAFVT